MNTDPDAVDQLPRDPAAARSLLEGLPCTSTAPQLGGTGHPVMSHRPWFWSSLTTCLTTCSVSPVRPHRGCNAPTCPETPALHGWGYPFWLR